MTIIEQTEQFFGARFLSGEEAWPDSEPGHPDTAHFRVLNYFDGTAHWNIILDDRKQWMWITGNDTPGPAAVPIMEVGVFYGTASLYSDSSMSILKIHPNNTDLEGRFLRFTRYGEGRVSFCAYFGDEPSSD